MHLLPGVQFDHGGEQTEEVSIQLAGQAALFSTQQATQFHHQKKSSASLHL